MDVPLPARFGPEKVALAPVLLLALGSVPLALTDRRLLGVLLVPLACAVWVVRARVVVAVSGLEVCNGLRRQRLAWSDVEGYDVPRRGPVRVLTGGRRLAMTSLRRAEVRALVSASAAASSGTAR